MTRALGGWFRRRAAGDAGVSLAEFAVVMAVGSILAAAIGTVFVGTMTTTRVINVRTSTSADVRLATEAVSRTIRVAYQPAGETSAIVTATPTSLWFYALLNRNGSTAQPLATLVEYAYNGTCLTEAQTPARTLATPSSTGSLYAWDTGRTSKCLLRTATGPTFSYYTTGALTSGGVAVPALTVPSSGLVLADRQSVKAIEADLTARDAANPSVGGVSTEVRVSLQNVIAAAGGS